MAAEGGRDGECRKKREDWRSGWTWMVVRQKKGRGKQRRNQRTLSPAEPSFLFSPLPIHELVFFTPFHFKDPQFPVGFFQERERDLSGEGGRERAEGLGPCRDGTLCARGSERGLPRRITCPNFGRLLTLYPLVKYPVISPRGKRGSLLFRGHTQHSYANRALSSTSLKI